MATLVLPCELWRGAVLLTFGSYETIDEAAEVVAEKRLELFTHNDTDRR